VGDTNRALLRRVLLAVADPAPNPEQIVEARSEVEHLKRAVAELPQRRREILLARWLSGYFAVILRAVTIDGWVVIGILMMMAVVSWFVMVRKAAYLGRQAKGNASS
jgi:hypothetical protein